MTDLAEDIGPTTDLDEPVLSDTELAVTIVAPEPDRSTTVAPVPAGPGTFARQIRARVATDRRQLSTSLFGPDERPRAADPLRRYGIWSAWAAIVAGAAVAWGLSPEGPGHLAGLAIFMAGHLALLATLTLTSAYAPAES